jgi:pimeloyl-ACP methyl ester carboxylesterase
VVGGRDGGSYVSAVATTRGEYPVFIPTEGGEELFGIVTEPLGAPKRVALIMLWGGGGGATGRNRILVRIARRVAALGYHALRLDYHGVGESSGEVEFFRLDRPFVDDVLAGVRCLEERGVREVALAGWCFGARTALASADRIPELRGVALFNAPVRDFSATHYLKSALSPEALLRGLVDARSRRKYRHIAGTKLRAAIRSRSSPVATRQAADGISPLFSDPLARLAARGTPVLLSWETEHKGYDAFCEVRPELARLRDSTGAPLEEHVIPGVFHGETGLAVQDEVASSLEGWLLSLDAVPGGAA